MELTMSRTDDALAAITPGTAKWIMPESQSADDLVRFDEIEADEIRKSGLIVDNAHTAYKIGQKRVIGMLIRRPLGSPKVRSPCR
jgi:hypothetical protein